jgi:hypothetical protein
VIILKGHVTPCLLMNLRSFNSRQINSLWVVEVVELLIWSSGLASRVQLPVTSVIAVQLLVASVIAVTRTREESSGPPKPA